MPFRESPVTRKEGYLSKGKPKGMPQKLFLTKKNKYLTTLSSLDFRLFFCYFSLSGKIPLHGLSGNVFIAVDSLSSEGNLQIRRGILDRQHVLSGCSLSRSVGLLATELPLPLRHCPPPFFSYCPAISPRRQPSTRGLYTKAAAVKRYMKITLNTEHCVQGIQKANNITPSKSGTSYLRTMWLKASKANGTIAFMTTDGSTEYIGTYPAEVVEEGLVGVQSRSISELIRSLPAGLIHIETDDKNGTVVITQGRRTYKLPASSSTWFQEFSRYPEGESLVWNGESFGDIIEKIFFCISDDEDSSFGCLCIKPNGSGGIDFCGLDGNKFAITVLKNDELLAKLPEEGIKIQKKYIADIKKLLSTDEIEIMIGEKRFYIRDKNDRDMFSVPLTQLKFIDYSIFISKANQADASVIRAKKADLVNALSRNMIFNTKEQICVYLTIAADSITLNSSDKTTGSATETIPAQCDTGVPEVAFVTRTLIDMLSHLPGDDIVVKLSSQEGPCCFAAADDRDYYIIAMPMQVVSKTYYQEEDA